jgi:hypothetical protein
MLAAISNNTVYLVLAILGIIALILFILGRPWHR